MPPTCSLMPNVSIPLQFTFSEEPDIGYNTVPTLALIWKEPACQTCEQKRWYCGRESDSGLDIGCLKPPGEGLSRGARYGIILGVGIPGLVCLIGLVCFVLGKIKNLGRHKSPDVTSSSSTPAPNSNSSGNASGHDASTTESHPTTSSFCGICFSPYRPTETSRSNPVCNHHFHARCLYPWFRPSRGNGNRTCPLCRESFGTNSPTRRPSSGNWTSTSSISSNLSSQ